MERGVPRLRARTKKGGCGGGCITMTPSVAKAGKREGRERSGLRLESTLGNGRGREGRKIIAAQCACNAT